MCRPVVNRALRCLGCTMTRGVIVPNPSRKCNLPKQSTSTSSSLHEFLEANQYVCRSQNAQLTNVLAQTLKAIYKQLKKHNSVKKLPCSKQPTKNEGLNSFQTFLPSTSELPESKHQANISQPQGLQRNAFWKPLST